MADPDEKPIDYAEATHICGVQLGKKAHKEKPEEASTGCVAVAEGRKTSNTEGLDL